MKRALTANIGWIFITVGLTTMLVVDINLYSLTITFVGFFLRLVYNSEKYKFFKFLNSELLHAYGKSESQQRALSSCLFGFYRGTFDFMAIIILPFFIIPRLDLPWYGDWLIGIVYIVALKPIFTGLDEKDRELIKQIVNNYGQEI